jgi:isoleucyl-tRNA synthetase
MIKTNYDKFDLHKNYVDEIILVSASGKPMKRETDLIDVWFDSGSMPTAQLHYPFENKDLIEKEHLGVADFIAEGVDQTRGWFFTLHAIATMVFDNIAYKNVISNGLVLDKNGQKMSKRLGNAIDPFQTLDKYGPDATRWYMITNAQPWDNLKFDLEGIAEVQRKFFGTLYNTYSFFALYANLDGFSYKEAEIPLEKRPEIDRWIISKLNSLIKDVDTSYETYEPTKAGRAIQEFVNDHLSNWYVRLCRRRFWKGDYSEDKIAAYQTLYRCLEVVAQLASPIAPFYSDKLYTDLSKISGKGNTTSVHLSDFPLVNEKAIDLDLEQRMDIAQKVSSMVLSLRKKEQIKVRQPLQKIMIPILDAKFKRQLQDVADLILSEVNVKEIQFLEDTAGVLVKSIKPNFKTLGPKYGKIMKQIAAVVVQFNQNEIQEFERNQGVTFNVEEEKVVLDINDVEISTQDIPGWLVLSEGTLTVALDITISKELKEEGIAREFINRIQNLRKDSGFEVNDKITLEILKHTEINEAILKNKNYICTEILATHLELVDELTQKNGVLVELDENVSTLIAIEKLNCEAITNRTK